MLSTSLRYYFKTVREIIILLFYRRFTNLEFTGDFIYRSVNDNRGVRNGTSR